ncbi:hypothetical protein M8J77_026115 [Diaphorina citri]|nr:hypothetical protein M8J77_026115 [Diaphorina citri]
MENLYTRHGFPLNYHHHHNSTGHDEGLLSLVVVLGSSVSLVGLVFAFITYRLTVPDSLLYAQSSRRESNYLSSPNNTINNNNINYSNLVTCTPHCDDTLLFSPTFYNTTYSDCTNIHNTNVGYVLPDYEPRCRWPDNLIQINLQNPAHSTSRPTERGVTPLPIPPSTSPPPSTLPSSSSLPPSISPQSTSPPSAAHLLSVYYQNVHGLRTKLKDLRTNVHLENRDIFAFTETNLTESHFNSELGFDSFAVFRYDRCSASSKKKSGGGVLLAVSHSIPCSQISLCVNNIEQIFIRLFLGSQTFVIGLVYIPPASSAEIYSAYWDEVTRVRSLHPQDHFLLLGDYNLPDASWDAGAGVVPSGSTAQSTITIEQSFFQDFNQHNLVKNDNVSISRAEILGKLKSLNVHKGSGPDGIPNRFLKECRFSLAFPLFLLFNQSLSQGVFPRHWKKCFISPIPKRGVSKTFVTNYRPIAILSAVPKIFESLVLDKLLPFIHHSIIPHQHGFIPGKSVSTNLLEYSNFISSNLSSGTQVDSIYLDLTKAFDRGSPKDLI